MFQYAPLGNAVIFGKGLILCRPDQRVIGAAPLTITTREVACNIRFIS
jgi:hypothetical protein